MKNYFTLLYQKIIRIESIAISFLSCIIFFSCKTYEIKLDNPIDDVYNEKLQKTTEKEGSDESTSAEVISLKDAKKLVDEGNEILKDIQRNLQFKMDDSTQRIVMSIVDNNTGETIRQVPTEDVLALAKRIQESDGKTGSIEGYTA